MKVDVNEESGYDAQEKRAPEEVTQAKMRGTLDTFHDTENAMDEMLEADPNLEVWQFGQGLRMMFTPYCKLYDKDEGSTWLLTFTYSKQ